MSTTPAFRFDHVSLAFGERRVLDDVHLDIADAGITVVVGPSGCGKSTLLRLCNRLEVPTTGQVAYRGVDIATIPPRALRRRVTMVFQQAVTFPGTLADNIRAGAPELTDAQVASLLDRVGLAPERARDVADTLSGGEAQRLALGRALAVGPEVLLADEPTSALDHEAARRLEDLARALADDGRFPVVWVSHDREQVRRLADHVVTMADGHVVGTTR